MTNQHGSHPLELVIERYSSDKNWNSHCQVIENCVSDMLEKGANPNCTGSGRDSPLILAIKKNLEDVVISLLKAGANVSHIGELGVTVLEVCINR